MTICRTGNEQVCTTTLAWNDSDLRQEHLDFMVQARPGEFVVYTPEHIETIYVPLTPREQEYLL